MSRYQSQNILNVFCSKYVLKSNRHDYYFFPWNRDKEKLDLFDYFYPKWRLIKLLSGLKRDRFEKNTPKDGTIDIDDDYFSFVNSKLTLTFIVFG